MLTLGRTARRARLGRFNRGAPWILAALFSLVACKREVTKQHEALAQALKAPYSELCALDLKEGGGCTGMCQTWAAVERAHAYAVASEQLAFLRPTSDPETDQVIDRVKQKAQGVGAVLGNVCLTNFANLRDKPHDSESLPRIVTCADAQGRSGPAVAELMAALAALETHVQKHADVTLPRYLAPCEK